MNCCNNVGVIWMAEDDFSAKILRQLADFAGLTEQNSPAVAVLNSMETPEYLAAAESAKFNAAFCCLFRILPDRSIDIFIERNDFSIKQIAKMTDTKEGFVYDILYKGSWTSISDKYDFSSYRQRQFKYSKETIDNVKSLINEGKKTPREISNATKMPIKTVYYYMSKLKK